ncbi:hypothetical protein VTI74DRAFT_992 [Chaetomium olivicolor]
MAGSCPSLDHFPPQDNKQRLHDGTVATRTSSHRSSQPSLGETSKVRAYCCTKVALPTWICHHDDSGCEAKTVLSVKCQEEVSSRNAVLMVSGVSRGVTLHVNNNKDEVG